MKSNWKIANKVNLDFDSNFGLNDNVLQLIFNRGVSQNEVLDFLDPDYNNLYDPFSFYDMEKAIKRVYKAISNKEKICVYGDYDADGVCSSVLLVSFLKQLGADVFCYIPNRAKEGNGLNNNAIDKIKIENTKLIITVDTGIVAFDEVDYINNIGMEAIITDHHEPILGELPNAVAVIDPKVENCGYKFNDLAGAGVAFKFCVALALKNEKRDDLLNFLKWNLDIVAIATIADMVSLISENRTIVKYGMIVANKTRNIGLRELVKICNNGEFRSISVADIGFKIGPRINAAGRMDDAILAYNLFTTSDSEKAAFLAFELDKKNEERQNVVSAAVKNFIKNNKSFNDKIIIAHNDEWPVGVVGLVATKIREKFNLPVFAMTTIEDKMVGSGRSLSGFNITKAMQDNEGLFVKFGGHELACGCTVSANKYNDFVETMKKYAEEKMKNVILTNDIDIDMEISLEDISFDFYNDLLKLEPYGKGNEEPVFLSRGVEVMNFSIFGKNSDHYKMNIRQGKSFFTCFAFGEAEELFSKFKVGDKIDLIYKIEMNEWNGEKELRLNYIDFDKNN